MRKEWLNAFLVEGGAPVPNQRMPYSTYCEPFNHKPPANTRFAAVPRCIALHTTVSLMLKSYNKNKLSRLTVLGIKPEVETSTEVELPEDGQQERIKLNAPLLPITSYFGVRHHNNITV